MFRWRKGKRVIQDIEQSNAVWIRIEDWIAENESLVSVTGHLNQMKNGLRYVIQVILTCVRFLYLILYLFSITFFFKTVGSNHFSRHLMEEIAFSEYAETLPPLFHFIPSPHYHSNHSDHMSGHVTVRKWLPCDRTDYHHWMTFRDYRALQNVQYNMSFSKNYRSKVFNRPHY